MTKVTVKIKWPWKRKVKKVTVSNTRAKSKKETIELSDKKMLTIKKAIKKRLKTKA